MKKRPAAVLEADKPPASEAASVHSKEGSGSGEEKKPDHPEPAGAVTPVDMGYSIMTYASTGAVAIREKKAWEETAVSSSKSQKIPCPTQRHFGESKAKTSERWTCRAGETLGQGSSPIASVTLGLSLALAAKRKLFPLLFCFCFVGSAFCAWILLLRRFLLGSLCLNFSCVKYIKTPKEEYC